MDTLIQSPPKPRHMITRLTTSPMGAKPCHMITKRIILSIEGEKQNERKNDENCGGKGEREEIKEYDHQFEFRI